MANSPEPSGFCPLLLLLLPIICFVAPFANGQGAGGESPEMVAKWRQFVTSLSATQRAEFDRLHADAAGNLDADSLAQRVRAFTDKLDPKQKSAYAEIQQREGGAAGAGSGGDRERQRTFAGTQGRPPADEGGKGAGREGKGEQQPDFDKWIDSPEVSDQTREALRRVKGVYLRSDMDPVQQCKKIQNILRGIGTADKKRMRMPGSLLSFDCEQAGNKGVENLIARALTRKSG